MVEKYGVGTKCITNEGYKFEVVEKIDVRKRIIRFDNGYEIVVHTSAIIKGKIKNPYHKSVCGIGYFGVGKYKCRVNNKKTPEYTVWQSMLKRCYDEKFQERCPTYKSVTVYNEWLNFQNFSKWYEDNYPKIEGVNFDLDKDLLQLNVENKIYSPKTCIFLPQNVNKFLTNKQSTNTSGYIGVSWTKANEKWCARINLFRESKLKNLGYFATPEEAYQVYQQARKVESEKVKDYLRSLDYLSEKIIQLVK